MFPEIFEPKGLLTSEQTQAVVTAMMALYPQSRPELTYTNNFELLCAVVLSAQTTDIAVNKVTPALFQAYPTPEAMGQAEVEEIVTKIQQIGLYRNKAKFLKGLSQKLVEEFDSQVPNTRAALESLPGVGRKTANVVLAAGFGIPAFAVDTHIDRVTKRFHMVPEGATVRKVEDVMMEKLPEAIWGVAHHSILLFGRYQCTARKHDHDQCILRLREQMALDLTHDITTNEEEE